MKQAIIMYTRVPLAGRTKTRLMPYLSPEQCRELHENFLKKICHICEEVEADVLVFCTPWEERARLTKLWDKEFPMYPQTGKDLGEGMADAFRQAFALGYEKVLLMGTDVPQVKAETLRQQFDNLDTADIVINPTRDGGYFLIGMKHSYEEIWHVRQYGTGTVFEETLAHMRALKLAVTVGETYLDIDTPEDLQIFWREECLHCGKCTKQCTFLAKYGMDLVSFAEHPKLAYSCFLCGKCKEVCPKNIDGAALAADMRSRQVKEKTCPVNRGAYRSLLFEKNPYKFANYRRGKTKSVLFPGCNFPSFYPETMKQLEKLMYKNGIGVIYECCGKPVYELGLWQDALGNLQRMEEKLKKQGVEELIVLCPNCYYFLRNKISIPIVTIYEKLASLEIGEVFEREQIPVYLPCPDRAEQVFFQAVRPLVQGEVTFPFSDVQCCGLGGCASIEEPELAGQMAKRVQEKGERELYTYCASCVGNFRRKGMSGAQHILPLLLGVKEKEPLGRHSIWNRAKKVL